MNIIPQLNFNIIFWVAILATQFSYSDNVGNWSRSVTPTPTCDLVWLTEVKEITIYDTYQESDGWSNDNSLSMKYREFVEAGGGVWHSDDAGVNNAIWTREVVNSKVGNGDQWFSEWRQTGHAGWRFWARQSDFSEGFAIYI